MFIDLQNNINLTLVNSFNLNKDVIKVWNDKNIKVVYYNLFDKVIKVDENVKKVQRYDLVFEIVI